MRRDPRSFLWDAREAADAIESFAQARTFQDYMSDRMLRSAIERQFEIIGEAAQSSVQGRTKPGDTGPRPSAVSIVSRAAAWC